MVSYTDMDALVLNISESSSLSPSLYTSEGSALSIICCMQQDSRGVAAIQKHAATVAALNSQNAPTHTIVCIYVGWACVCMLCTLARMVHDQHRISLYNLEKSIKIL